MLSVEEFAALSQDEQVSRLRLLGGDALEQFGVEPESIDRLVHAENTTFKVSSPQGVFNLRISRPGYQTTSNIRSELAFLSALRHEGFRVPKPWQERVVSASHSDVPEPRDCVLLGWMNGEFSRGVLTVERARAIGRIIAGLHRFSSAWPIPDGFDRQHLHAWAFADRVPMSFDSPTPLALEEDRLLLIEVDRETRPLLAGLPRDPSHYGLLHSDLHLGNVLFDGDQVNVIDFDDTGFGFWIYDFAAALAYSVLTDEFLSYVDAMFEGYLETNELPPRTQELLNPFLQLRLAGIGNWVLSRPDNPYFRENGSQFVHTLCERIRRLRT